MSDSVSLRLTRFCDAFVEMMMMMLAIIVVMIKLKVMPCTTNRKQNLEENTHISRTRGYRWWFVVIGGYGARVCYGIVVPSKGSPNPNVIETVLEHAEMERLCSRWYALGGGKVLETHFAGCALAALLLLLVLHWCVG